MPSDPRIKHIVVLMMENRSFDHMLGFMKAENPDIRGIEPGDYTNTTANGTTVNVADGAQYRGQLADPGHEFDDVFFQMYGQPPGSAVDTPDMSGFARNYEQHEGAGKGADVLKCFRPEQLPVLSALARSYAVCDAWFSSVPGPTLPNRAFAHFGSSFGRLDMSPDYFRAKPNIYSRLKAAGRADGTKNIGRIYYFDRASSTLGMTFLLSDQPDVFAFWADFKNDCKKDKLPAYSFIEPNYKDHDGFVACDQHPDNHVFKGDEFIADVYNAIRQNDAVWKSTLLLIVWDEHGGLFDHEIPPTVSHSDHFVSTSPPFDFNRLGVRVPAVVVSPYIAPGTVSHIVFEHASIPATVTEQFIGDPLQHSPFEREKWAPRLLQLLNDGPPRMDRPSFAPPAATGMAALLGAAAPRAAAPTITANPSAPISTLLKSQLVEAHRELERRHPKLARGMNPAAVRTHGEAAKFMKRVIGLLDAGKARAPKRVARRSTRTKRKGRR